MKLAAEERDVLLAEIEAVRAVAQGEYGDLLDATAAAVGTGSELDGRQAAELERIVSLGLQTGRIRALYGPSGEQAALRTFRKLPAGSELAAGARQVSEALSGFSGQPLDRISIAAVGPGAFTVSLVAGGAELSIRLDQQGARLASVGV